VIGDGFRVVITIVGSRGGNAGVIIDVSIGMGIGISLLHGFVGRGFSAFLVSLTTGFGGVTAAIFPMFTHFQEGLM
jgi:hypothetical protein